MPRMVVFHSITTRGDPRAHTASQCRAQSAETEVRELRGMYVYRSCVLLEGSESSALDGPDGRISLDINTARPMGSHSALQSGQSMHRLRCVCITQFGTKRGSTAKQRTPEVHVYRSNGREGPNASIEVPERAH